MKSLLLSAISFLCFAPLCLAQVVWPGDVNNNGIVNEIDLLYLGYAFNETGPPRATISAEWTAQNIIAEWTGTFPDGLNFVYADCNGDGIINELDADVIEDNIDSLQNELLIPDEILISASDLDPKFAFDSTSFNAVQGVPKEINLNFGSDIQRIPNVQGFSFTISGDTRFFKAEDIKFRFVPLSWLELTGRPNISKFFPNTEEGKLTISFIKTDNQAEMGGGQIGAVSFVLIEDIVDFRPTEDTIKLEIDSITVVTDELEKIVVAGASTIINVPSLTTSIKILPQSNKWLAFTKI